MTMRQEVLDCIAVIPDEELIALRPLLHMLAYEKVIVETDLTDDEKEIIRQGRKEYAAAPDSFIPLDSIN
ncbi:MAG: hypothetical protein LBU58_00280 [Clostridiales bacterium]|jgi:hypothetical protein|nr:hypothetical protein [Clostridiales bacterium]